MIKVKELRIGNLIFNDLAELRTVVGMDLHMLESYPERAHGIPLTEEWLIKFGFEKNEEYDFGFSGNKVPRFEKSDISIMLSGNKFWYATRQYDGGTSDPFEAFTEVKYVHQIQNLYYALTSKELTGIQL